MTREQLEPGATVWVACFSRPYLASKAAWYGPSPAFPHLDLVVLDGEAFTQAVPRERVFRDEADALNYRPVHREPS